MSYDIEVYPDVQDQIRALPEEALRALAEAISVLELAPGKGDPYHRANPDGAAIAVLTTEELSVTEEHWAPY